MGVLGVLDGAIFLAFHSFLPYPLIFLFCRGLGLGILPLAVLDWGPACPDFARVPAWALGPPRRFIPLVQVPVRLGANREWPCDVPVVSGGFGLFLVGLVGLLSFCSLSFPFPFLLFRFGGSFFLFFLSVFSSF